MSPASVVTKLRRDTRFATPRVDASTHRSNHFMLRSRTDASRNVLAIRVLLQIFLHRRDTELRRLQQALQVFA